MCDMSPRAVTHNPIYSLMRRQLCTRLRPDLYFNKTSVVYNTHDLIYILIRRQLCITHDEIYVLIRHQLCTTRTTRMRLNKTTYICQLKIKDGRHQAFLLDWQLGFSDSL